MSGHRDGVEVAIEIVGKDHGANGRLTGRSDHVQRLSLVGVEQLPPARWDDSMAETDRFTRLPCHGPASPAEVYRPESQRLSEQSCCVDRLSSGTAHGSV